MQGKIRCRIGLLTFVSATALVLTGARGADDVRTREVSGRSGVTKTVAPFVSTDETVRGALRYVPLDPNIQFTRKVVVLGGGAKSAAAVGGEKLAYSNVNGKFAAVLPRNSTISDDLTLTAKPGCRLRRFTFEVIGRADPTGLGGPYTVNWVMFNTCPAAGGSVIADTLGEAVFPDDAPRTIEVILPEGVILPSSTIWLGVRVNRSNAGVVMGTPPFTGFSGDLMDFPLANCSGNLGGFPEQPHASFNVEVFVDESCQDAYVAYRNLNPGRGGENEGRLVRFADDLELNVSGCQLCAYEVGLRGQAAWSLDIRRDNGGVPGTVIPGTEALFFTQDNDRAQIGRFLIDPPIRLGSIKVWVTVKPNARTGKWILVGRDATVGRTAVTFAVLDDDTGQWDIRFPDREDEHGGYYVTLFCAGQPPLGACCDMFILDEEGEAVCRDVPEMNCAYPARGSAFLPRWSEGGACRVCDDGCNDGERCSDDNDCRGSVAGECVQDRCIGGCRSGLVCIDEMDCPGADNGVCDDNPPFSHTCGTAACCKPDGFCDNLTQNECNAVPPTSEPRQWQRGKFCGEGLFQRCPWLSCLRGTGDCFLSRRPRCSGGCEPGDGALCKFDFECRGECFLGECRRGCRPGAPCSTSAACNDDGVCVFVAPDTPVCIGGARDGQFCDPDRGNLDCWESYCERKFLAGCEDQTCCETVCNFCVEFWCQYPTDLCCTDSWDESCAELARVLCLGGCQSGPVEWVDPPRRAVDARRPHLPDESSRLAGIDTLMVIAPKGAHIDCWSLCETEHNPGLHPPFEPRFESNEIINVERIGDDSYIILLKRPITPGEMTAITYRDNDDGVALGRFVAHPGDVNADGTADMRDLAAMLDILQGTIKPPWGLLSADINRDGVIAPPDLLELIDLLTGTGAYEPWLGSTVPGDSTTCP